MFLKKLFYASASILMLAAAYHLGASTAVAQAPSNPIVAGTSTDVYTANGDHYYRGGAGGNYWYRSYNIFTNAVPDPVTTESFGSLKAKYR